MKGYLKLGVKENVKRKYMQSIFTRKHDAFDKNKCQTKMLYKVATCTVQPKKWVKSCIHDMFKIEI